MAEIKLITRPKDQRQQVKACDVLYPVLSGSIWFVIKRMDGQGYKRTNSCPCSWNQSNSIPILFACHLFKSLYSNDSNVLLISPLFAYTLTVSIHYFFFFLSNLHFCCICPGHQLFMSVFVLNLFFYLTMFDVPAFRVYYTPHSCHSGCLDNYSNIMQLWH